MAETPVQKFEPSHRPATETEQAQLRHSLARAMAFIMPGLGHAFNGAIAWALAYAAAFWFAMYRFWVSLGTGSSAYVGSVYVGPNELPAYLGWLGLAVVIWVIQLMHVAIMGTND